MVDNQHNCSFLLYRKVKVLVARKLNKNGYNDRGSQ